MTPLNTRAENIVKKILEEPTSRRLVEIAGLIKELEEKKVLLLQAKINLENENKLNLASEKNAEIEEIKNKIQKLEDKRNEFKEEKIKISERELEIAKDKIIELATEISEKMLSVN